MKSAYGFFGSRVRTVSLAFGALGAVGLAAQALPHPVANSTAIVDDQVEIPASMDLTGMTLSQALTAVENFNSANGTTWTLHSFESDMVGAEVDPASGFVWVNDTTLVDPDCAGTQVQPPLPNKTVARNRKCSKPGRFKTGDGCMGVIVDAPSQAE